MSSKRWAATTGAVLLAATGLTVGVGQTASAATCYGGAEPFKRPPQAKYSPTTGWYKTTSRCNDINIKIARIPDNLLARQVRVCFENGGCQSVYKRAKVNEWTVIATDVKDGTTFRFQFETADGVVGHWAA